jgi:sulfur carrier protein
MEVIINDHTVEIPSSSSLNDALSKAGVNDPKGIAVAVNNQVVPKTNWQSVSLKEHDEILVIQATQGG